MAKDEAAAMAAITAAILLYLGEASQTVDAVNRWKVAGRLAMFKARVIPLGRASVRRWLSAPRCQAVRESFEAEL